eukprot:CAMPEP_0184856926 /NCGR_PEP_ID=MMETSP0580-20130426/2082_1 /TAXON_ID=1118495 /ORGANISM="Dactyliosolen fragilissimus" /LENGTH=464 /DNA_ID=CAMNT_0027352209 /DNA_START=66 /DNA_END=1457 /DNA_ORIENTATION=+
MINMQNAFLITSKNYSEKEAGVMFFVFGMSQFFFQTPAGYLMDYSDKKVTLLGLAAVLTTMLTIATAILAKDDGENFGLMVFFKLLQGAVTALIPPGLNSITQGIVGSEGMTDQVSKNEIMNHFGTAIIVLSGSLLAFGLYPNIGMLFIVSPIACIGMIYFLCQIRPEDIDHNVARGLVSSSSAKSDSNYKPPTLDSQQNINNKPSFIFGFGAKSTDSPDEYLNGSPKADTPLKVLRDPLLLTFILICFCFHLSNATVLPLVMQTLALDNGRSGILMSGSCIIVSQIIMVLSAKICGDYSGVYGRKKLFIIGLLTLPIRCFILTALVAMRGDDESNFLNVLILSTQLLDGVGAGIFGTMYVLVTSDISGGTGRFSLTLGLTTSAMSIGGTISGYLGQALAQDVGYREAFLILGFISLISVSVYLLCMPETLPSFEETEAKREIVMTSIAEGDEENVVENKKYDA